MLQFIASGLYVKTLIQPNLIFIQHHFSKRIVPKQEENKKSGRNTGKVIQHF